MASHGELADGEHDADRVPDLQLQFTAARDGPVRDVVLFWVVVRSCLEFWSTAGLCIGRLVPLLIL